MPTEGVDQAEFRDKMAMVSKEEAFAKLQKPIILTSRCGQTNEGKPLVVESISGFEGEKIHRQTIHYLVLSPELTSLGLALTGKTGELTRVTAAGGCLLINPENIQAIAVGGRIFRPATDPWENLRLLEIKPVKIEKKFQETLDQVIRLWQSALRGEKELNAFLEVNMDKQTLAEILDTLVYLKNHPQLQRRHYDLGKIDPWQMADLPSLEKRQKYLKQVGVSPSFLDGGEVQLLMEIADKIRNKQDFTAEDVTFLDALALAETAVSGCAQYSSPFCLTPLNDRFALANIAENYFLRNLVPDRTFPLHQKNYQAFTQLMKDEGEEVPEWFTPFRGEEFRYAPAVNRTIAHVGGKYFFNIFGETADSMAGILDHERIHFLTNQAKSLAKEYPSYHGFHSDEAFTECLAFLIKHHANVAAVLESADIDRTCYGQAVEELLKIILEVDGFSGKDRTGVRLLFQGLVGLPGGEVKGLFEPLERYYDENKVGGETKFSERMAAFSDERRLYSISEIIPPQNSPKKRIREAIKSITYEEVKQKDPWETKQSFLGKKKSLRRHPMQLIETAFRDETTELAYGKMLVDEGARKEMQLMVEGYYRNYIKAVKNWLTETQKRGALL